jgi:hypothetical protein
MFLLAGLISPSRKMLVSRVVRRASSEEKFTMYVFSSLYISCFTDNLESWRTICFPIFLVELIGFDRNEPESPEMLLSMGNAPTEDSRKIMDDELFAANGDGNLIDEDEDDFGLDEFDDDYSEDDLTDFNEYEY